MTPPEAPEASLETPPTLGLSPADGFDSMCSHKASNNIQSINESTSPPDDDLWLFRDDLPTDIAQLRMLSDLYFSRVHTQRCLGFIYRPTWMLSLDQGVLCNKYGEALVALVCALGARCLSRTTNHRLSQPAFRQRAPIPGHKWAERAKVSVLSTLMQSSLRNVMALTLLTEYCLQIGQFADAFQLLGNCYRSIRLLSLDSPAQYLPTQVRGDMTQKESQVRIVWACYTMDHVLSAGVPQNSSWSRPPPIPLPVPDSDFLSQMSPSTPAPLDLDAFAATSGVGCTSPRAHYIYLSSLRTKALRMIRQTMTLDDLTSPESSYLKLINEIDVWYNALPEALLLSSHRIYALQEMKTLSATMHLHLAYHAAVAALTRISLPGFNFPLSSTMRRAPPAFISQCQTRCRYHSDQISRIIEIALPHGMEPFDDQFCGIAALEASKVQIIHAAIIQHGDSEAMQAADRCIRNNLALMEMTSAGPNLIPLRIIVALLKQHSFTDLANSITEKLGSRSLEKQPTSDFNGTAENCYLTAIAPFRIAREGLQTSGLSSPTSMSSLHADERSPESAPPLISTIQNAGSQDGDTYLMTPGGDGQTAVSTP
ncbi:hypothetical protein BHE90_011146 [Fusarium euwallaceae]|uniref:Xylanolytic transcriptional activator regulatory domain-containing protein n=2 Tax=Fusarium solani species complex TaxID=232080 RepID=A0A3M2SJA9_9HYPO|nr:hypothetical protein CDV36_002770 [Fusarium kuroshium]RTE74411.1 hypothetical protein BHE90_011146 [Fusarium euwallaceae]